MVFTTTKSLCLSNQPTNQFAKEMSECKNIRYKRINIKKQTQTNITNEWKIMHYHNQPFALKMIWMKTIMTLLMWACVGFASSKHHFPAISLDSALPLTRGGLRLYHIYTNAQIQLDALWYWWHMTQVFMKCWIWLMWHFGHIWPFMAIWPADHVQPIVASGVSLKRAIKM